MKRVVLIVSLVLVLPVSGCGGGGAGSLHTLVKSKACLRKNHDVKLDNNLDFVASTATGGALHLKTPHNAATVVFGETVDDANNINDAYHRFKAKNVGLEDVIRQDKNTVILFRQHPTDDDLSTVEGCLK